MYLSPLWSYYVGFPSVLDASLYLVVGYTNTILLLNPQGISVLQTKVASPINCVSADKYILIGTNTAFYIMSWDGRMLFIKDIPTYFCSTKGDYVAVVSDSVTLAYKVYNNNLIFLNAFPTNSPVSIWKNEIAYTNNDKIIIASLYGEQLRSYNATYGIKSIVLINDTVYTCGDGIHAYGKYHASLNVLCFDIDADRYIVAATSRGLLLLSPSLRILSKTDIRALSVAIFKKYIYASTTSMLYGYYVISNEVDLLRGISIIIIAIMVAKWLWDRRPMGIPPLQVLLRD